MCVGKEGACTVLNLCTYIINSCHEVYGAICIVIKAYFVTKQHLRAANEAVADELIEIAILGEIAVNCA